VTLDVSGPLPDPHADPPVLNVQLRTEAQRYRDHLVDVDFRGERTIELDGPSADRVLRELPPGPGTYRVKSTMLDADLSRSVALDLRWMRGAVEDGVVVRVARLEVLLDDGRYHIHGRE